MRTVTRCGWVCRNSHGGGVTRRGFVKTIWVAKKPLVRWSALGHVVEYPPNLAPVLGIGGPYPAPKLGHFPHPPAPPLGGPRLVVAVVRLADGPLACVGGHVVDVHPHSLACVRRFLEVLRPVP